MLKLGDATAISTSPVNITTVTNINNENQQTIVVNGVDDAVITDTNAI